MQAPALKKALLKSVPPSLPEPREGVLRCHVIIHCRKQTNKSLQETNKPAYRWRACCAATWWSHCRACPSRCTLASTSIHPCFTAARFAARCIASLCAFTTAFFIGTVPHATLLRRSSATATIRRPFRWCCKGRSWGLDFTHSPMLCEVGNGGFSW